MSKDAVILIREINGIGIDKYANGYLLDGTPIERKFYNGRLCYNHKGKRIGFKTLKDSLPKKIVIENSCPF